MNTRSDCGLPNLVVDSERNLDYRPTVVMMFDVFFDMSSTSHSSAAVIRIMTICKGTVLRGIPALAYEIRHRCLCKEGLICVHRYLGIGMVNRSSLLSLLLCFGLSLNTETCGKRPFIWPFLSILFCCCIQGPLDGCTRSSPTDLAWHVPVLRYIPNLNKVWRWIRLLLSRLDAYPLGETDPSLVLLLTWFEVGQP